MFDSLQTKTYNDRVPENHSSMICGQKYWPALPHHAPFCFYLVIVVMTMEEGLLPEDHASQHTAKAPHIQAVIIHLRERETHTQCFKRSTEGNKIHKSRHKT